MSIPLSHYSQYYLPQNNYWMSPSPYQAHMSSHDLEQSIHQHIQTTQAQVPIDPSLQLYYPNYNSSYQQGHQHSPHQQHPSPPALPQQPPMHAHMTIPALSPQSPSSRGSEFTGTPPADGFLTTNGKRSSPSGNDVAFGSRKKSRHDEDEDAPSPSGDLAEGKVKATRGSRACTVCRRLKMKCVGAEQGPPCKRCEAGNHHCIFEESNRGKRTSNSSVKKHEQLTRSLRKMEKTLDTVLRSIGNPSLSSVASGMVSRSPSPSVTTSKTQALLQTPSPPPVPTMHSVHQHSGSPRLHSLPDNELNPLGLLAEASLAKHRSHQSHSEPKLDGIAANRTRNVGVASDTYFKPGPMTILPLRRLYIERQVQPEMLSFVSTEEVVSLFKIFFEKMNIHTGLLDPALHTPSLVCSRSPFLLTTICAIASKFYDARPELHLKLSSLSRKLAFSVPEKGFKSAEIVQGYVLLALWGCDPVERYEQDKTWLLLGMGIRMAMDLNLHRKTTTLSQGTSEARAREMEVQNRERTWLICYILDRSMSAQMGKPHSIKEDFIIQNTGLFWTKPVSVTADKGIAAYTELQRILSRSLDLLYSSTTSASGLITYCNYYSVTHTIEAQLHSWLEEWIAKLVDPDDPTSPRQIYWLSIGKFYFNYAMLVVNSFGLQNALDRSPVDVGHFFTRCHSAAVTCATVVRDELGPQGFLRYSPDSHFVQCSYAILSLLKFTRPAFRRYLADERSTLELVQDVADLLERIAAGPLHTPALYSTFLKALISAQSSCHESPRHDPNLRKPEHSGEHGHGGSSTGDNAHNGSENGLGFLGAANDSHSTPGLFPSPSTSEMGPVADMSTFPPTMAPQNPQGDSSGMLSMDSILSTGFWDSVLVPGYSNSLEGLSGGFVYGAGGSGLITPKIATPQHSGASTPINGQRMTPISEGNINAAFETRPAEAEKMELLTS